MPVRYSLSSRGRNLARYAGKAVYAATSVANYKRRGMYALPPKKRKYPGRTSVKSRPKKQRRRPAPPSSGGQSSVFKYSSPMSKYTRAALAGCQIQTIQDDLATMFHSTIGNQSASIWANFGDLGMLNRVTANYSFNFGDNSPNLVTRKFNIVSEVHDSSWSNPGTMPLDLIFYSILYKKDSTWTPIAAWNDGQVQEGDINAAPPCNNYRALPHRSSLFTQHFKIANMKRVTLQPGEIHKRKVSWSKPRGMDQTFFEDGSQINTSGANYSMTQMVVMHGYPAPVNTGTVTNPISSSDQATISPATVCVGVRRLLGYKFHTPLAKTFITSNTLIRSGTVTNETELVLKTESDE